MERSDQTLEKTTMNSAPLMIDDRQVEYLNIRHLVDQARFRIRLESLKKTIVYDRFLGLYQQGDSNAGKR